MLSKKDKNWLSGEIRKVIREELTVTMHWEKMRNPDTGEPLAHPERWQEEVFLPSFFVQHLKFHEGAFRGMQEDVNKSNNRSAQLVGKVNSLGHTLIGMENSVFAMAEFANLLNQSNLLEKMKKQIEK